MTWLVCESFRRARILYRHDVSTQECSPRARFPPDAPFVRLLDVARRLVGIGK